MTWHGICFNILSYSFEQAHLLMLALLPTHLLVIMGTEFNLWISFHYQPFQPIRFNNWDALIPFTNMEHQIFNEYELNMIFLGITCATTGKKSMINKGGTPFHFLDFWHFVAPPSLAFTFALYLLNFLMWSFCKCFFINVLPWIGLYYNNLLCLWVLLLEHEEDTLKGKVGWRKVHLIICIACTSIVSLAWVKQNKGFYPPPQSKSHV